MRRHRQPHLDLATALEHSRAERLEVYRWLFRTRHKRVQDRRIATLLEQEAFLDIHAFWPRLGYPFDSLVPSLATANGSSADQPGALAELLGIIAMDGVRFTRLDFAAATPFETHRSHQARAGDRVLPREVAAVARRALQDVVARGTARRLNQLVPEQSQLIGAQTGMGDHRLGRYGERGELLDSKVMNRSAVVTFLIGERFFGTATAFVPGPEAAGYRFTSTLPVQLLGRLLPVMAPLLDPGDDGIS